VDFNDGTGNVTCDYTVTKTEGTLLDIALNRVLREGSSRSMTTGTIVYDPAMTIPTKGHLVTTGAEDGLRGSIIDFNLVSDSFAKH
jgi:hypothetical protein